MKTLLVPTDFQLPSLNCIPELVQQYDSEELNIVLVHLMKITDSVQELLMLSKRSNEYRYISDEFYSTCTALKQAYACQLLNIRIELFYGSTLATFKSFTEANEVDAIVMLDDYPYRLLTKSSINPASLVSRSGLPVITLNWNSVAQIDLGEPENTLMEKSFNS